MNKKELYITKMKSDLDKLNHAMDELSSRAHEARLDARDKYHAELARLREQSQLALSKLSEVREAGEDKWESLAISLEKLRDAFSHSFHYFKAELKK